MYNALLVSFISTRVYDSMHNTITAVHWQCWLWIYMYNEWRWMLRAKLVRMNLGTLYAPSCFLNAPGQELKNAEICDEIKFGYFTVVFMFNILKTVSWSQCPFHYYCTDSGVLSTFQQIIK